jgi:hypothetical protein
MQTQIEPRVRVAYLFRKSSQMKLDTPNKRNNRQRRVSKLGRSDGSYNGQELRPGPAKRSIASELRTSIAVTAKRVMLHRAATKESHARSRELSMPIVWSHPWPKISANFLGKALLMTLIHISSIRLNALIGFHQGPFSESQNCQATVNHFSWHAAREGRSRARAS